jgi:hypothetical protein
MRITSAVTQKEIRTSLFEFNFLPLLTVCRQFAMVCVTELGFGSTNSRFLFPTHTCMFFLLNFSKDYGCNEKPTKAVPLAHVKVPAHRFGGGQQNPHDPVKESVWRNAKISFQTVINSLQSIDKVLPLSGKSSSRTFNSNTLFSRLELATQFRFPFFQCVMLT